MSKAEYFVDGSFVCLFVFIYFIWYNSRLFYSCLYQVSDLNQAIENEKQEELRKLQATQASGKGGRGGSKEKQWNNEDLQILIKAANLFPPGTVKR